VPSKSGDKNYLRASNTAGNKYVVKYTDKAGKENRWAVNSKRLISSAGLDNKGGRVPGLMPTLEDGKVNFYVVGNCDDLGDNVRLVDANSSN
jgi:phosphoribosylformylglycinamidine (FGAM) synthase-like amidotransferase family enzyme